MKSTTTDTYRASLYYLKSGVPRAMAAQGSSRMPQPAALRFRTTINLSSVTIGIIESGAIRRGHGRSPHQRRRGRHGRIIFLFLFLCVTCLRRVNARRQKRRRSEQRLNRGIDSCGRRRLGRPGVSFLGVESVVEEPVLVQEIHRQEVAISWATRSSPT